LGKSLKINIDRDIEHLIPEFMANRAADIKKMQSLLRLGDRDSISKIAHRMKGAAGSYGFSDLSEIAARIESEAQRAGSDTLNALISALTDHLESLEISFI